MFYSQESQDEWNRNRRSIQQNSFHQTIHQSSPIQPKSTKSAQIHQSPTIQPKSTKPAQIHQSPPIQPKCTSPYQISQLTLLILPWPPNALQSPAELEPPNPSWRDWHWEMGWGSDLGAIKPKQNPTAVLKGKKGMGMAEDGAVWSNTLRANEWAPATPNFAAFPWHVNILHQEVVLLFQEFLLQGISFPTTRFFLPCQLVLVP